MTLTKILGFGLLLTAACGSSSSNGTGGPTDGGGQTDAGSCGVALSWKQESATCQAWMDQNCCAQAKACSNDVACSSFVACVNACPVPRQDACTSACGAMPPAALDELGACTKQSPPAVATKIPNQCEWP
jgi:hypothetical protein